MNQLALSEQSPTLAKLHAAHMARQGRKNQARENYLSNNSEYQAGLRKRKLYEQQIQQLETWKSNQTIIELNFNFEYFESIAATLAYTAQKYSVTVADLKGARRFRKLVQARNEVYFLARKHTQKSFPQIGKLICKDHTTVLHGLERYKQWLSGDLDGCSYPELLLKEGN